MLVTYCCDKETGLNYRTDYKRLNPEDSNHFDEAEARKIRAVPENSYPFITIDEMKNRLKDGVYTITTHVKDGDMIEITVVVDGYMLIGALSMDTEVPDVEESLTFLKKIIKNFKDFFSRIASRFE